MSWIWVSLLTFPSLETLPFPLIPRERSSYLPSLTCFKFQWLWNTILTLNTVFVLACFCWMMNNNYFLYPIPIFNFCCINTFWSFPFGVLYANNCSKFYLYNGVISPIITPNNTRNNCSTDNCKFISPQPKKKKKKILS